MIFIVVALPDFFLVEPSGCVEYFSYYYTVLWLQGVPDMYLQYAYESYFLFDLFKRRSKKLFGSCCPCCLLPKEFLYQIEHLLVLGWVFMFFLLASGRHAFDLLTWRLHSKLFIFIWNTSLNILNKKTTLIWILEETVYTIDLLSFIFDCVKVTLVETSNGF